MRTPRLLEAAFDSSVDSPCCTIFEIMALSDEEFRKINAHSKPALEKVIRDDSYKSQLQDYFGAAQYASLREVLSTRLTSAKVALTSSFCPELWARSCRTVRARSA